METGLDGTVSEAFCRVTEQLAFMFVEPAEKDGFAVPEGPCVAVGMDFSGALEGSLRLAVPMAICADLAGNMLGADLDGEQAEAKGMDALREVLNVTCGNILTGLAGMEPVFALTIPEVTSVESEAWEACAGRPGTLGFLVEEHPALLEFELRRRCA